MKPSFLLPTLASLLLAGCATNGGPHAGDVVPTWLEGCHLMFLRGGAPRLMTLGRLSGRKKRRAYLELTIA